MARESERGVANDKKGREERALATEKDHQVRLRSVARDTNLQLPVHVALPDGEEFPGTQLQIRCNDQRAEIQKGYIQGPPNKTICDSSQCIDWATGDVRSSRSSTTGKASSKGQLWGLKLSTGGKSPPSSSSRPRDHGGPRHSSNLKNPGSFATAKHSKGSGSSSSSSTCSSTSSSSSSCTGLLPPPTKKPIPPKTSISEKIHTVFSEKLFQIGDGGGGGGSRTSPNNNSSSPGTGMLSRLDETKYRRDGKAAKKQQQQQQKQQQQQVQPPSGGGMMMGGGGGGNNGAGGKITTSLTTTTTISTRTSSSTTVKCDASLLSHHHLQQQPLSKKSAATIFHHQQSEESETFSSERVSSGGSRVSDSDNNGNGGVAPLPCLILGAASASPPKSTCATKTDEDSAASNGQRHQPWANPFLEGRIDCFSQTSTSATTVQSIPRTAVFSHNLGGQSPSPNPAAPPAVDSTTPTPHHYISAGLEPPDSYSLASVDVELLAERH